MKDTARRFAENEEVVVTANQFDRDLAARFDLSASRTIRRFTRITGKPVVTRSFGI